MQWHQLDHMQTIRTLLQTDNQTSTSSLSRKQGKVRKKPKKSKYGNEIVSRMTSDVAV